MKILKWTSVKEYYSQEDGTELTKQEVEKHYIIIKTDKYVKLHEEKKEGTIYYRSICSKSGKQLSIALD